MTYQKRPPSRRDRWKARVLTTPTLSHGTRLFLVHTLAKHMKSDGFVSHPRKKLAWEANLSERQVTRYMSNAVDAGWLVTIQAGYRSMTAEYQATFPNHESGTQDVSHSRPEKRDANWPPLGVTNTSLIPAEKRDVGRPTTSSSTTRRLRVVDTVRTHAPSRARSVPSSLRFGFGADIHQPHPTARTTCRTQPQADERHRRMTTAAQVETKASGTEATTPFDPEGNHPRKAMNEMDRCKNCNGCGVTTIALDRCAQCGGSGYENGWSLPDRLAGDQSPVRGQRIDPTPHIAAARAAIRGAGAGEGL